MRISAERIARRMTARQLPDCTTYLALLLGFPPAEAGLHSPPAELDALIAELTIGETYFFRHRELFDALRSHVLPDVLQRKGKSLALFPTANLEPWLFHRGRALLAGHLAQTGTGSTLGRPARSGSEHRRYRHQPRLPCPPEEGRFEEWAFRSTPEELKQACFLPVGRSWLIAPEYKEWVRFQYHNMVQQPFPSLPDNLFAFDIILCRNVLIYFNQEIIRRLLEQFHDSLVEGGWLLVGHAEPNIDLFRAFRTVNAPGVVLYQKTEGREVGDEQRTRSQVLRTQHSELEKLTPPPNPLPEAERGSKTEILAFAPPLRFGEGVGGWGEFLSLSVPLLSNRALAVFPVSRPTVKHGGHPSP